MNDNQNIIQLSGEYDATRRDELDHLLDRYGDLEPLVLDLSGVSRIDTAALRSLIRFQRARREAGRTPIAVTRPSEAVQRLLRLAELETSFDVVDAE